METAEIKKPTLMRVSACPPRRMVSGLLLNSPISCSGMARQMPVMNGYEATKAIRRSSHELAKTIPIIAMTANAFSEDIQHSLAAGMNAHVSKPVEMKVLEKTIRSIKSGGGHRNAAH